MKRRLLSLFLSLVCLLSLAACGKKEPVKPEDDRVVLTLEGEDICFDYFRYAFLHLRDEFSYLQTDGGMDEAAFEAHLKEQTLSFLLRYRAVALLAEEYGISLSKGDKEDLEDEIDELIDYYGEEAFEAELLRTYMTRYTLTYLKELDSLQMLLKLYAFEEQNGVIRSDDETVLADISKNFTCIRYVYIKKDESKPDNNRSHAETVLGYAKDGQDFKELIRSYGQDNTMLTLIDDGYYYTILSEDTVEEAVAAMNVGEISDLIEVSHGYFIVEKLPLDMDYVDDNFEDLRSLYKNRILEELVEEKMKTITVETTTLWELASTKTVQ